MRRIERVSLVGCLLVAPCASAAWDLQVSRPAGGEALVVAPGSAASLTLRFTNAGDTAAPADIAYHLYVDRLDLDPEFTFAMAQGAPCSPLTPLPGVLDSSSFTVPSLLPQASIECTIKVTRLQGSRSDVLVGVEQDDYDSTPGNWLRLVAGQPSPSDLQVERLPSFVNGDRIQQYFRIRYRNGGTVSLQEMGFARCTDGVTATVELDFPGACTTPGPSNHNVLCFMGSEDFALPGPIAPGATSTCMVRMSEPLPRGPSYGSGFHAASIVRNSQGGYTALLASEGIDLTIDAVIASETRPRRVPALGVGSVLLLVGLTLARAFKARQ